MPGSSSSFVQKATDQLSVNPLAASISASIIAGSTPVSLPAANMPMRPMGNESSIRVMSTPSGMIAAAPPTPCIIEAIADCSIGPATGSASTSLIDDERDSGMVSWSPST